MNTNHELNIEYMYTDTAPQFHSVFICLELSSLFS